MDTQQLKLLAGQVRGLLQQSNHTIGHSQALDLIAALPGLRNWPEVQAFPDRVSACELDLASTSRLAYRLKRKFDFDLTAQALLTALAPPSDRGKARLPQLWPSGPKPGVYITTSEVAIAALVERWDEATDGALGYAEEAASGWEGCIRLGDYGLWSDGLERAPSGTLVIVGPLQLDQQSWKSSGERLEMACLQAWSSDLRVAVLVKTPTPDAVYEDLVLAIQGVQPEGAENENMLMGIVTDDGEMLLRAPFAHARPRVEQVPTVATIDALPVPVREPLTSVLARHRTGLVLVGSEHENTDQPGIDYVASMLAFTEHAGPAARIMPRHRSSPAKDWMVPDAIKQLPFLPSIESAFAQGYRRLVVEPHHTKTEVLLKYGKQALIFANVYGGTMDDVFMTVIRAGRPDHYNDVLSMLIAILGITPIEAGNEKQVISDLYTAGNHRVKPEAKFQDVDAILREHRAVRWEDQIGPLMDRGLVSAKDLKKEWRRQPHVDEFLASRKNAQKVHAGRCNRGA